MKKLRECMLKERKTKSGRSLKHAEGYKILDNRGCDNKICIVAANNSLEVNFVFWCSPIVLFIENLSNSCMLTKSRVDVEKGHR